MKSSSIFSGSFRVNDSLKFKHTHRSKPLAAWASQCLDSHHPGAQLHDQILAVICLTPPHTKFKAVGDSHNIYTYPAKDIILFSVLLAESSSSFTYKKADFGGQGLHELERAPPLPGSWAVLGLCQRAGTALSLAQPELQALQIHHAI